MITFINILHSICKKQPLLYDSKEFINFIAVGKSLAKEPIYLRHLKLFSKYLWYLKNEQPYYFLYCTIPSGDTPKFKKIIKEELEENKIYDKIQEVLGWSKRELKLHRNILDRVIDEKHFKKEFGYK